MPNVVVSQDRVRHISVPQYQQLSIQKMLQFLVQFDEMHNYMPSEPRELNKLPRDWVVCIAASVVGDQFYEFIKQSINERNAEISRDRNMLIAMDPQLAQAFNNSTAISRKYSK